MYLPYLSEASYMYSPANHYIVLKRYSLLNFFVCLGFFGEGWAEHLPSLFDASYGSA